MLIKIPVNTNKCGDKVMLVDDINGCRDNVVIKFQGYKLDLVLSQKENSFHVGFKKYEGLAYSTDSYVPKNPEDWKFIQVT